MIWFLLGAAVVMIIARIGWASGYKHGRVDGFWEAHDTLSSYGLIKDDAQKRYDMYIEFLRGHYDIVVDDEEPFDD